MHDTMTLLLCQHLKQTYFTFSVFTLSIKKVFFVYVKDLQSQKAESQR